MKVIIANKFNYLKGGADRYFLDLTELLQKNGIQVAKFSMRGENNLPDENEKYFVDNIEFNHYKTSDLFRFFFKYLSRLFYSREAARKFEGLIADFKPDIIHLQNIYNQISPSIINVAKKYKLPVIMHLHDYNLICPNYKLFTKNKICFRCKGGKYYNCVINKCVKDSYVKSLLAALAMYFHHSILKIYDQVDLFIAPSQFMKDICIEFGVPAEKIVVINNFIDSSKYHIPEKNSSDENYMLYLGRLVGEKGINTLIKAFAGINDSIKLKIVGEGPGRDKLQIMINNYQLENRIELVGAKKGEELGVIFSNAYALIVPSEWPENLPYVVLESFLYGKPVIASRVGGLVDMIREGQNGFLFEAGNIADLTESIKKVNSGNINQLSAQAKSVSQNFLPARHFEEIMKIYKKYVQ